MKKILKRIVAAALSAVLALSLGACKTPFDVADDIIAEVARHKAEILESIKPYEITNNEKPHEKGSAKEEFDSASKDLDDNSEEILEPVSKNSIIPDYEKPDEEECFSLIEDFLNASENGDKEALKEYYDKIVDKLLFISTMDTVAFLNYAENVQDTTWKDEEAYCDKLAIDFQDKFFSACREVLNGKLSDDFKKYADSYILENCEDYEEISDELKALFEKETELEKEYESTLDSLNDYSVSYKSKDYYFHEMFEDDSNLFNLAMMDMDAYSEVEEQLLGYANEVLGEIYLELVKIRVDIAKENGYDNYSEYAYAEEHGRSYSLDEAEKFCNLIKNEVSEDYYDYINMYVYAQYYFDTEFSEDELIDAFHDVLPAGSDLIDEAYDSFKNERLYSIGNGERRFEGSFTIGLDSIRKPFIFTNTDFSLSSVITLTHEFGHFTDFYSEYEDYDVFNVGNLDVMEICSNGLQLLCANHLDNIVSRTEANLGLFYNVADEFGQIIDGCVQDEFQRYVYDHPDMTLEEMNECMRDINDAYHNPEDSFAYYGWVLIPHTFTDPLYYISYAISALSALEIWDLSIYDEKAAVDTWLKLVEYNDGKDYFEVMEEAELTPFTDSKGVRILCESIIDIVNDN